MVRTDWELQSDRLVLRRPCMSDVHRLAQLIGDWDIASNLGRAPYPYGADDARAFIEMQHKAWAVAEEFAFAITLPASGLIGMTGISKSGKAWELGYWVGKDWWGRGYVTEAAQAVLSWSEKNLGADGFTAGHYADNPASGKVLRKLGFSSVGEVAWFAKARDETVRAVRYCKGTAKAVDALRSNTH